MKPILILVFVAAFLLVQSTKKSQHKQVPILPETPKAYDLDNVFGYSTFNHTFGPQPKNDKVKMTVLGEDGKIETISVKKKILNKPRPGLCEPKRKEIKLCAKLDCDYCVASPHCGWCGKTNTCVPGSPKGLDCPNDCLSNWLFNDPNFCKSIVKAGSLTNIAPDAAHLVSAELVKPKVAVSISSPETIDQTIKVQVGVQKINEDLTTTDPKGNIHTVSHSTVAPLVGELHESVPIAEHVETKYIDLTTGHEISQEEKKNQFFGVERQEDNSTNSTEVLPKNEQNNTSNNTSVSTVPKTDVLPPQAPPATDVLPPQAPPAPPAPAFAEKKQNVTVPVVNNNLKSPRFLSKKKKSHRRKNYIN